MKFVYFLFIYFLISSCEQSNLNEIKKYHINGNLKSIYFLDKYKKAQGKECVFFKNGKLKEIRKYRNGNLNGFCYTFFENGKLKIISKFSNDIQVDTTYFFSKKDEISAICIYDKKGNIIKEIIYYPNGKVQKVRDYFSGTGQINAWKENYNNGKLNKNKSNYVKISNLGNNNIKLLIIENSPFDTIYVRIIESFQFTIEDKPKLIRELKFTNINNVKFKILESDYIKKIANIEIIKKKWLSVPEKSPFGIVNCKKNEFHLQLFKGKNIPLNNINGIY